MLDELLQQPQLHARQGHRLACPEHLGAPEIHYDVTELVPVQPGAAFAAAAQQRFEASQQLDHLEGLGQIIVGAELETDDLVHRPPTSR